MMTTALEYVQRADDVAFDIGMRVLDGVAHAGLGRQVHDFVELLFGKQRFHGGTIGEIDACHREIIELVENGSARLFQRHVVVVVEVIEADDGFAAFQKLLRGGKADKAGRACNENFHVCLCLMVCRGRGPLLQAVIDFVRRQHILDVVEHRVLFAEAANAFGTQRAKLIVRNRDDHPIIRAFLGVSDEVETVFLPGLIGIHPGIVHVDFHAVGFQLFLDVDHLGVPEIGTVFLEGQSKNEYPGG